MEFVASLFGTDASLRAFAAHFIACHGIHPATSVIVVTVAAHYTLQQLVGCIHDLLQAKSSRKFLQNSLAVARLLHPFLLNTEASTAHRVIAVNLAPYADRLVRTAKSMQSKFASEIYELLAEAIYHGIYETRHEHSTEWLKDIANLETMSSYLVVIRGCELHQTELALRRIAIKADPLPAPGQLKRSMSF